MDLEARPGLCGHELNANGRWRYCAVQAVIEHTRHMGVAGDIEVRAAHNFGGQEGRGHRGALALGVDEGLEAGDAECANGSVDVRDRGDAGVNTRGDEAVLDNGREVRITRLPGSVGTTMASVNGRPLRVVREAFHAAHIWRQIMVGPALTAVLVRPLVKVGASAVMVHHGID